MTYVFIALKILLLLIIFGIPIYVLIWAVRRKRRTGKLPWLALLVSLALYAFGLTGLKQFGLTIQGLSENKKSIQSLGSDVNNPVTNNSVKNQNKATTETMLFTDDKKNFSFEYPTGYSTIKSVDPTPIGGTSFLANYAYSNGDGNWYIQVVTSDFTENVDPNTYLVKEKEKLVLNYTNVSNSYVAGELAVMFDNVGGTTSRNIDFIHDGLYYSLSFSGFGKDPKDDIEIEKAYALVRSSFSFLK